MHSPSLSFPKAYSAEEKGSWKAAFERLRSLIVSYCGMTLEDPTMFPQPARYGQLRLLEFCSLSGLVADRQALPNSSQFSSL